MTGSDGKYRFLSIRPGDYTVTATVSGFGRVQKKATVTLDSTTFANMAMQMSASAEVTVTGEAPLIDTSSTTTGSGYTSKVINQLPVGFNYADIVKANPASVRIAARTRAVPSRSRSTARRRSKTRKSLAATSAKPSEPLPTANLAEGYRAFRPPETKPDWSRGPAKYILTAAEKEDFERITDFVARSEFIANFRRSHDPRPETPENEFREEFEKRVAFADARFTQDETRGSLTDRGIFFIVVGPPTYNGQRPLNVSDEAGAADVTGQSRFSSAEVTMTQHATGSNANKAAAMDRVTNPSATMERSGSNWIESWTYLRAELPKAILTRS